MSSVRGPVTLRIARHAEGPRSVYSRTHLRCMASSLNCMVVNDSCVFEPEMDPAGKLRNRGVVGVSQQADCPLLREMGLKS